MVEIDYEDNVCRIHKEGALELVKARVKMQTQEEAIVSVVARFADDPHVFTILVKLRNRPELTDQHNTPNAIVLSDNEIDEVLRYALAAVPDFA
jgi:hypothetical protein